MAGTVNRLDRQLTHMICYMTTYATHLEGECSGKLHRLKQCECKLRKVMQPYATLHVS
jgi:hypothetical protein